MPFKGIRYAQGKGEVLERVISPPYDVISQKEGEELYEKSDYNVIRLILGKEFPGDDERDNKYSRAANFFQEWLGEGIIREDEESCIYIYEQVYSHEGRKKVRWGFLALLKLEDFDKGVVLPHEETLSRPREDRLRLLRACRANLSPIFTLYSDPARTMDNLLEEKREPLVEVEDAQGEKHRLWAITSKEKIERLKQFLSDKEIYLADRHHRYETALNFRNEMRQRFPHYTGNEAYNYLMAYLTNIDSEGLALLPAHRLVSGLDNLDIEELKRRLSRFFEVTPFGEGEGNLQRLLSSLEGRNAEEHLFGMYGAGCLYLLRLRNETVLRQLIEGDKSWSWKRLDITILHQVILNGSLAGGKLLDEEQISYLTNAEEAFRLVKEGRHQLAFFVNPPKVSQMRDVARMGEKMPGKATYFYPKLLSGLVMRKIS